MVVVSPAGKIGVSGDLGELASASPLLSSSRVFSCGTSTDIIRGKYPNKPGSVSPGKAVNSRAGTDASFSNCVEDPVSSRRLNSPSSDRFLLCSVDPMERLRDEDFCKPRSSLSDNRPALGVISCAGTDSSDSLSGGSG